MALKDEIAFGMALPHRSTEPLDMAEVRAVAQRAEALGFRDLWVTENVLDRAYSFEPFGALTFAAAVTTTIRLGVSVVVLPAHSPIHVAHQTATLDYLSNGRAILGVGLGRDKDYAAFQVPTERRVRRFREGIEIMKALWTQEKVTYAGDIFRLQDERMALKPRQNPYPPLLVCGDHPNALKRAAALGDGWMGGGAQTTEDFKRCVTLLKTELKNAGRDPAKFLISKRVFIAVHETDQSAREQVHAWFNRGVSHNPQSSQLTDLAGVYGTPTKVREQLEALKEMGANHIVLNPNSHYLQQLEALAEIVGLHPRHVSA